MLERMLLHLKFLRGLKSTLSTYSAISATGTVREPHLLLQIILIPARIKSAAVTPVTFSVSVS